MRFQSRVVLAGSVLGMFAASTGVALLMPERADGATVAVPEFAASAETQALPPAVPPAVPPAEVAATAPAPPLITGAEIAALAVGPARERATALIEQARAAEAEQDDDDDGSSGGSRADAWRKLRDEIREACDDGRIRGQICRG